MTYKLLAFSSIIIKVIRRKATKTKFTTT